MSEEENKITSSEKSFKIKDPKRVELGKRLAKISKEVKARKKLERESAKSKIEMIDFKYVVGGVAILGGIFGIYFAYKKDKRETKEEKRFEEEENKLETKENKFEKRKGCLENL